MNKRARVVRLTGQNVTCQNCSLAGLCLAKGLPIDPNAAIWPQLAVFIASGYVFKLVIALLDTGPFYIGVHYLGRYLEIDPHAEHGRRDEDY